MLSEPVGCQDSPERRNMKIEFSGSVWKYSPSSTCKKKYSYEKPRICKKIEITKGQLVSKCIFGVFNFLQKTNENKSTWGFIVQSNLVVRNVLIRNKLVLRNPFPWPIVNLLHKDKEHLVLMNNFRVTKKFLITKFDCSKQPWAVCLGISGRSVF